MFLLDTDHLSIVQWGNEPAASRLAERIAHHPREAFFVSIISFHEQVLGCNAYLSRADKSTDLIEGYSRLQRIMIDYASLQVLPFDASVAAAYQELPRQRLRLSTMDARIGATALAHDLTLLTRNVDDFARIPELRIEDWTSASPT